MANGKLTKLVVGKAKRVGRGPGSGKGKTAGRGTKGQNARNKLSITHPHFEGGQRVLFKRLPYKRGKGNTKAVKNPIIISINALNQLPSTVTVIDLDTLIKHKIVQEKKVRKHGVKILGGGKFSRALTINVPVSKSVVQNQK